MGDAILTIVGVMLLAFAIGAWHFGWRRRRKEDASAPPVDRDDPQP